MSYCILILLLTHQALMPVRSEEKKSPMESKLPSDSIGSNEMSDVISPSVFRQLQARAKEGERSLPPDMKSDGKSLWGKIGNWFNDLWNKVVDAARKFWNWLKDLVYGKGRQKEPLNIST